MAQRVAGELYFDLDGQLSEIKRQLRQPNGYPFNASQLQRALQNAIEGKFDGLPDIHYLVTVNYDLSVEDAVKAGKYDWKNDRIISKNFPSKRKGKVDAEIILVKFAKDMESEAILLELDKQGLRPAELPELLAFGEKYPEVQREFPIVALGSVWRGAGGVRCVPCLDRDSDERGLYLLWFDVGWGSGCRFAALRK
jgi:hypothetical protein